VIRRGAWLTAGVVLGAGGTVWTRRRVGAMAERARAGAVPADLARLVQRGARRVRRRVGGAVEAGRVEARRREGELRTLVHAGWAED
jgi:hypothetical protein